MKLIMAIIKPFKLDEVREALTRLACRAHRLGGQRVRPPEGPDRNLPRRGISDQLPPKVKIEVVVGDDLVDGVMEAIAKAANTDKIGDGKIFVLDVERAMRIRTGETDTAAL